MPRLFVNNLTAIDCSILDPKRGLIGASWAVDIELEGDLDHQSMVFDFAKVKKTIKRIIDSEVDHKLVIPTAYKNVVVDDSKQSVCVDFKLKGGEQLQHRSASQALCLIDCKRITRNKVITFLTEKIHQALPNNVQDVSVQLRKEKTARWQLPAYCTRPPLENSDMEKW